MIDYRDFVSKPKSLLIAPAGYGKTHTIAECLKYTEGIHLILTHTHAGVASLKDKIKKNGITSKKYNVETIDSFAQKYVNAFYRKGDIPEQENSQEYFEFIIQKATYLVKIKPIREVIQLTYSGLFVDEYQDCTINRHHFIMAISELLPIHILGDPLQGIFDFKGAKLITFEKDLDSFRNACFKLTEPWRWKENNPRLGYILKDIRSKLEAGVEIDLNQYDSGIEILQIEENDIYYRQSIYNIRIEELLGAERNLLLIYPDSKNLRAREKIIKTFKNRLYLVEAMDGKDFYRFSKIIDNSDLSSIYKDIHGIMNKLFNKTELDRWFNENGVKNKREENDKKILAPITEKIEALQKDISFVSISKLLEYTAKKIPKILCYRKELFNDLRKALEQAEYEKTSVYEAMKNIRNVKRRMGRKIYGKCIGTTLLTKGLEFDTVAILGAHKFTCPKNLYVALTRASKRLVVFTQNMILTPNFKIQSTPEGRFFL